MAAGATAIRIGADGGTPSWTRLKAWAVHCDTLPATSTACADTAVVALAAIWTATRKCPSASAAPDAATGPPQASLVKRSTRAPASASPKTSTCLWFVGGAGTEPARTGAGGGSVSTTAGQSRASRAQTLLPAQQVQPDTHGQGRSSCESDVVQETSSSAAAAKALNEVSIGKTTNRSHQVDEITARPRCPLREIRRRSPPTPPPPRAAPQWPR